MYSSTVEVWIPPYKSLDFIELLFQLLKKKYLVNSVRTTINPFKYFIPR